MKKILLLIAVLLLSAVIFVYFRNSSAEPAKAEQKENRSIESQPVGPKNETPEVTVPAETTLELQGVVVPEKTTAVAFEVGGTLENGEEDFRKGMKFRKNQLLFQVNNYDAFVKMQRSKQALKEKLNAQLAKLDGSSQEKWKIFTASLEPVSLVADLPTAQTAEERELIQSISKDHQQIKQQETGMSAYFCIAPFNGIVIERSVQEGEHVVPKQTVAQIARAGKMLVKCKAPAQKDIPTDAIEIFDQQNKLIGKGKFVKSVSGDWYLAAVNGKLPAYGSVVKLRM